MTPPTCQGEKCKHATYHYGVWHKARETGEFYQSSGWYCNSPRAAEQYKPNARTGGVQMGKVSPTCRGNWYEART